MHIELMEIHFYLEGCRSLKEKRQRLSGLRERFGKRPELAVREYAQQDSHSEAAWAFLCTTADARQSDRVLQKVEQEILQSVDATVVKVQRQTL